MRDGVAFEESRLGLDLVTGPLLVRVGGSSSLKRGQGAALSHGDALEHGAVIVVVPEVPTARVGAGTPTLGCTSAAVDNLTGIEPRLPLSA